MHDDPSTATCDRCGRQELVHDVTSVTVSEHRALRPRVHRFSLCATCAMDHRAWFFASASVR